MERILNISDKDKIKSHIYKMLNKSNNKIYIGQAVTHRLNKKKYRYLS